MRKAMIKGSWAELKVAMDLLNHGYEVFQPMNSSASCDLITMSPKGDIYRIEVKTGNTRPRYNQIQNNLFDVLANVDEDYIYYNGKYPFPYTFGKINLIYKKGDK
mgnify:CR=1 FL=1